MALTTNIQWCHCTVNAVMGCHGCELWPRSVEQVIDTLAKFISRKIKVKRRAVKEALRKVFAGIKYPVHLLQQRDQMIGVLASVFPLIPVSLWKEAFGSQFLCYAGVLHANHGPNPEDPGKKVTKGYAGNFNLPQMFPGRLQAVARKSDLLGMPSKDKPWLDKSRRLIFVSDMGDALSDGIPFDFLKEEVIDVVNSADGRRHVWLWLSKRPNKMAKFAEWLRSEHKLLWPSNLVAMTTVTGTKTAYRLDQLRSIPARLRGVSIEPLESRVSLNLEQIDWAIVGGESGNYSRPFDAEWARDLREQCRKADTSFFMKQLGSFAVEDGFAIAQRHNHGGDWNEWPDDLRIRDIPQAFKVRS